MTTGSGLVGYDSATVSAFSSWVVGWSNYAHVFGIVAEFILLVYMAIVWASYRKMLSS